MAVLKCKMCGGTLEVTEGMTVCECEYCGTMQTIPKTHDDVTANLFNRANNLRSKCEFDKSQEIYEKIVANNPTESEAYWGIILCKYGIEYVEDPATFTKIPTCHRTQLEPVQTDADYLTALDNADSIQREVYEKEAQAIDRLQKNILEIVHKEQPFDVFICYKETDDNGKRTPDSVIANDIYHQLTQEGFKVFYAAITLEDKLGQAYEPYIFAALNSAKVMLTIGTKPEYFNAVWVKNEWSRYLKIMKNDRTKLLIPCYKDMDAYNLPEEFSHLQAQDMGKIGFINDVIRGIKKVLVKEEKSIVHQSMTQTTISSNVDNLLKRGNLCLEDGKWSDAENFFEQVLNENVEEPRAYLGKLMVEFKLNGEEQLLDTSEDFSQNGNYIKAYRFGDDDFKKKLFDYKNEREYRIALRIMSNAKTEKQYEEARAAFLNLGNYKDATEKAAECERFSLEHLYSTAVRKMELAYSEDAFIEAKMVFNKICGYKDSAQKIEECETSRKEAVYQEAVKHQKRDKIDELAIAIEQYERIDGYKDSREMAQKCRTRIKELDEAELKAEKIRVAARKEADERLANAKRVKKKKALIAIMSVAAVIAAIIMINNVIIPTIKYNELKTIREDLPINKIDAGSNHTIGLRADGTVIAVGENEDRRCDVYNWTDIVAVSTGGFHTVGLKPDGTVVSVGNNSEGECSTSNWTDITDISTGYNHTVGLKSDGTVVAIGGHDSGQCDVSHWTDIVDVSAGSFYTIGIKSNGRVIVAGDINELKCKVSNWSDIVAVAAGGNHTVGLKSDGTVVAVGYNDDGQCDVSEWTDIVAVSAGNIHTVGLKSDGTVVAVGKNNNGQCDVSDWTNIVAISAENSHTVGLKSDGTVVAVGSNGNGQCNVSDWTNIKTTNN